MTPRSTLHVLVQPYGGASFRPNSFPQKGFIKPEKPVVPRSSEMVLHMQMGFFRDIAWCTGQAWACFAGILINCLSSSWMYSSLVISSWLFAATLCFSGYPCSGFYPSEAGAGDFLVSDLTALASGNKKTRNPWFSLWVIRTAISIPFSSGWLLLHGL